MQGTVKKQICSVFLTFYKKNVLYLPMLISLLVYVCGYLHKPRWMSAVFKIIIKTFHNRWHITWFIKNFLRISQNFY